MQRITIALPIKTRARSYRFYQDALGLEPFGEPHTDGMPEPLQFRLGEEVQLMLIPRKGFGWVLGEQPAADAGQSECLLEYAVDEDEEVDAVLARAEAAGASIVNPAEKKPWGYTASFTDPDGHLWTVANTTAW